MKLNPSCSRDDSLPASDRVDRICQRMEAHECTSWDVDQVARSPSMAYLSRAFRPVYVLPE